MGWSAQLTFPAVPGGVVVGQVHKLVDEVGLAHVRGQAAQLLVGGQVAPGHGILAQFALLEHLRVLRYLLETRRQVSYVVFQKSTVISLLAEQACTHPPER